MIKFGLSLVLGLTLSSAAMAAGDAAKGKALYAVCASCHGANGEGVKAMNGPRLEGQDDWYMKRQLQNFKNGIRGSNPKDVYGMQMKPMAMTLKDDKAIDDVVAYILTFKKK